MRFPFSDHFGLLEQFLHRRQSIARELERRLFSGQGKAAAQNGDRETMADVFDACFFQSPGISADLSRLKGQLEAAHLADGFEPVRYDGYSRELDPIELVFRACHYWNLTRWPGTKGRLAFAQSLYAVGLLRQLERLSLRIWDPSTALGASGNDESVERLRQMQRVVDLLNTAGSSAQELRFVRDARWLIQTAQGPLTRHLAPYFTKAAKISALPRTVKIEIQGRRRSHRRPFAVAASAPFPANRLGVRRTATARAHAQLEFNGHGVARRRSDPVDGRVRGSV